MGEIVKIPSTVDRLIKSATEDLSREGDIECLMLITIRRGGDIGLTVGPNSNEAMRLAFLSTMMIQDLVAQEIVPE